MMTSIEQRNERRRLRRILLKKINEVVDPCSIVAGAAAGLVDFGLIRGVDLTKGEDERWRVRVRLVLTEPGCIMGGPFAVRIHERLSRVPEVSGVEVGIDSARLWTEASMSERYAARLAAVRARRVIPIAPA